MNALVEFEKKLINIGNKMTLLFNDPILHNTFLNGCEEIAQKRREVLNKLAEDIKTLEEFLKTCVIPDNEEIFKIQDDLFLGWVNSRLVINSIQRTYPLIEAKISIRIKCRSLLPDFLRECKKIMEEN